MNTHVKIFPSLKALLRLLKQDAMVAIKECRSQYANQEKAHYDRIYDVIGFIAAFTAQIKATPSDMRSFLADEYWNGKPHEPKAKNVVRLTTMYVLGVKESKGALYQQALAYSKVVDYMLRTEIDPVDVSPLLKRKTIYRLLDEIDASRNQEEPAAANEPVKQQAQAKNAKNDHAVYSSSRDDGVKALDDDEEVIDAADEAGAVEPEPIVEEDTSAASTPAAEEDDDLLAGVPDPKQEQREWERDLIKRVRAARSEGYEVLLVTAPRQLFDDVVQHEGDGFVELKCKFTRSKDWQALKCLQARAS